MFNFINNPHTDALNTRIAALLNELENVTGSSDEYTKTTSNIAKLMELQNQFIKTANETAKLETEDRKVHLDEDKFVADQEKQRSWKPSPDAIVGAAASVIGILAILHHEKFNVVTSKALGFVGRGLK
jgi:hypothetical protein